MNIVPMPGKALTSEQRCGAPNPELISRLEQLLDEARAGQLQEVAYTCLYTEGGSGYGWTATAHGDLVSILGGLTLTQVEISMRMRESKDD